MQAVTCCRVPEHAKLRAGERVCPQCVKTSLHINVRENLASLLDLVNVETLSVGCAHYIISELMDLANKADFPLDLHETVVKVLDVIIDRLDLRGRAGLTSRLLDTSLTIANGVPGSGPVQLALLLIPECIKRAPNSQRLLATKKEELLALLVRPNVDSAFRRTILLALRETAHLIDIMAAVVQHLQNISTVETEGPQAAQLTGALDTMSMIVYKLPPSEHASSRLLGESGVLFTTVKLALMSRDTDLQVSGAQCLLSLLLRNDAQLAVASITADLGEFLSEAMATTNQQQQQMVIRCIAQLCTSAGPELYSRGLAARLLQSLMRTLQLLLVQPEAIDVTLLGFRLLSMLIIFSQKSPFFELEMFAGDVLAIVRQALTLDPQVATAAARVLADLTLSVPRGSASAWEGLVDLMKNAAAIVAPSSEECSCLVLRLARGAISCTLIDSLSGQALREWAEISAVKHSENCVLRAPVAIVRLERLVAVFEHLVTEPTWDGRVTAHALASLGFLEHASKIMTDARFSQRGPSVLAHLLAILTNDLLHATLSWQDICLGLKDLSSPWLTEPPRTTIERDSLLSLCYCHALASPNPIAVCAPLLPGLHALLATPLTTSETWPAYSVKACWFVLANASLSQDSVVRGDSCPKMTTLLKTWSSALRLIYTHNPVLLYWSFAQPPGELPLHLQAALISLWLKKGGDIEEMITLLEKNPDSLPCFLEVVQGGSSVANAVAECVCRAFIDKETLACNLWLRLPKHLQRSSVIQGSPQNNHGLTLILNLTGRHVPTDAMKRRSPVTQACGLMPACLARASTTSLAGSLELLEIGLKVSTLLLMIAEENDDSRALESYLGHSLFLKSLQMAIHSDRPGLVCAALQFATAIHNQNRNLGNRKPHKAITVWIEPRVLLNPFSPGIKLPSLQVSVMRLLGALPALSPNAPSDNPLIGVRLDQGDDLKLARELYNRLHQLACKMPGGDQVSQCSWRTLTVLLQWPCAGSLVRFPWTHTLILSSLQEETLSTPDVVRDILTFVAAWLRRSDQEMRQEVNNGTESNDIRITPQQSVLLLTNNTVRRLLQQTRALAELEGCKESVLSFLQEAINIAYELKPDVLAGVRQEMRRLTAG